MYILFVVQNSSKMIVIVDLGAQRDWGQYNLLGEISGYFKANECLI